MLRIFLCFLIIVALSCLTALQLGGTKADGPAPNCLTYEMTQCDNPFPGGSSFTDEQNKSLITSYLASNGIRVYFVEIVTDPNVIVSCAACHCGYGKTARVSYNPFDLAKVTMLNASLPEGRGFTVGCSGVTLTTGG